MSNGITHIQKPVMEPQCSSLPSAATSTNPSDQDFVPRYTPTPSDSIDYAHGLFQESSAWHHEMSAPQYSLVTSNQQRPTSLWRRRVTCSSAAPSQSKNVVASTCPRCRNGAPQVGSCSSCLWLPTASASPGSIAAQQRRSRDTSENKGLAIRRMPTRVVYRAQLVSSFVDLYLSYDKIAKYQHADLANLPGVDFSSPTLQAAADTICFIGLGAARNDQRLIAEARVRYGCALHLLAQELSEQRPQKKRFRQTVTSITLLQMCELFDGLSYHNKSGTLTDGWKWHLEAVQRYMRECGPQDLLQSDYDWQLFQNLRHYTFYADVQHCRPSMFAEPQWLAMTAAQAERDPAVALYNLRTHLPGLMAKVKFFRHKYSHSTASAQMLRELERLQTDIRWLRTSLGNWMERSGEILSSSSSSSSSIRSTLGLRQDPLPKTSTTPQQQRPPPLPAPGSLLQSPFHFTSVKMASLCTTAWMLCLATNDLHTTLLGSIPASTSPSPSPSPSSSIPNPLSSTTLPSPISSSPTLDALRRDSDVCATNLARCVAWCSQASIAPFPIVGDFHLRFVQAYFRKNLPRCAREAAWCEAMSEGIWERTRGGKMGVDHPRICHKIATEQVGSLLNA